MHGLQSEIYYDLYSHVDTNYLPTSIDVLVTYFAFGEFFSFSI